MYKNALTQNVYNDDKQIWINDRIINEMRHIIRADNVYKITNILRESKFFILDILYYGIQQGLKKYI
jgi:hypothetical protein